MDSTDVKEDVKEKEEAVSYDEVVKLAMKLSPLERLKLIERLAYLLKYDVRNGPPPEPRRSLLGALAHLGQAPSAEEIDQNRREMLAGYSQENE